MKNNHKEYAFNCQLNFNFQSYMTNKKKTLFKPFSEQKLMEISLLLCLKIDNLLVLFAAETTRKNRLKKNYIFLILTQTKF